MAKRILAFVLVLVLTMSILPVSMVSADEISDAVAAVKATPKAGTHTDAGHGDDCGVTTGWLPWDKADSLPASGNYYLTQNVTLTTEHTVTGNLNLCLNGYVIKQTGNVRVMSLMDKSGSKLTICDCTAYVENDTYYAGAVTGGNDVTATGGGAIFVRKSNTLEIFDGRFIGNRTQTAGGAILTQAAATVSGVSYPAGQLTIHNGEFSHNIAVKDTAYKSGGAIYIANGTTLTVHNGIFANNKGGDGGVFAVTTGAKLIIENGKFENNRSEGNGGVINAILIGSATTTSAKMEIKNGTFTGNSAKTNGGILDMGNGAQLTVTGGTFENNSAAYAGVFYLRANTVGISGATLKGNSSTGGGSAIYVYSTVKLTLGDGTVITQNTCSSKDDTDGMGAAICMGTSSADARVTLTGKVYIAGNEIVSKKFGDLTFRRPANDTLRVNGLADGSCVVFSAPAAGEVTDPDDAANPIIKVEGTQDAWKSGWVAFKDANGVRNIGRDGTDFMFVTGHFHDGVEYLPLTSADQLIAGGAYYLPGDVTLNKAIALTGTTETSICLNSHKLTSTVTSEAAFSTKTNADAATFNIDDCTAYTDADGVYHAGAINGIQNKSTGHGGGVFMIRTNGTLNFYGGKLTNNSAVVGGGAIFANGTVKMYGGELSGNQAVSGTAKKNGGAIYINYSSSNANNKGNLYAENVIFKGNDAPYAAGGAVYVSGPSEFKNCKFIDNNAGTTGGALHIGNGNTTVEDCEITENSAVSASAINLSSSSAQLIIKNTTITGNTANGYGAVNVIKGVKPVKLQGKVIITDNLNGTDQGNFHVQNDNVTDALDATGLTSGSEIGVRLHQDRTVYTFSTASASNNKTYFTSDNGNYTVELNADNKLYLKETTVTPPPVVTHKHTLCNDAGCTEHTSEVTYEAWTDATKLPTEGNWYLDTDVTVSAEVQLKAQTLNLCLNGHTIKGFTKDGARAYATTAKTAATINISDCTAKTVDGVYTAGKFTGFNNTHTNSGGSAIYIREGSHLNFFDGIVEKSNAASGGAIYVHTATANIYNGLITNNTAKAGETWKPGAGLFMYKATVNVHNAQFTKNEGSYGAAIYFADGTCVLTLKDVKITDNEAQTAGGAINAAYTASKLTISGNTVIEGNTVNGAANNVRLGNTGNIIVENLGANAKVGINAGGVRAFSNVVGANVSAQFPNDDPAFVTYMDADGKLAQKAAFEHIHCVCGKADCTDASHEKITYMAWTNATALPKSGNYCLDTDVTITAEAQLAKDTTLNLCLNGHKVTGKGGKGVRFFSTSGSGGEVLNIADCTAKTVDGVYTAGGFYDNDNTHTNSGGGAIYIRAKGVLNFYDGIVSGNKCATGGAAFYGKQATLNFYNGLVTGNMAIDTATGDWRNGAAFYLDASVLNLYGGTITGNEAGNSGAIGEFNKSTVRLGDVTITGNKAQTYGAGINFASAGSKVIIDGNPVVTGNTQADGKASNVRLAASGMFEIENMGKDAKLGVTATVFRAISNKTQDYTANVISDDPMVEVVYQDEVLYTLSNSNHKHCICAMAAAKGCDHTTLTFAPWTDAANLPTSGNYYLDTDVTISTQARLENTNVNLCLNGHTIKVTTGRAYYMTDGAKISITDCAGEGKFTGATLGAILSNSAGKDMEINLYAGTFTENHAQASGGALVVQGDCVFNMYGGKITGNTATSKLNTNADGSVKLDSAGNQSYTSANGGGVYIGPGSVFNLYAGEVSGNTVTNVEYLKAEATKASSAGGYAGGVAVYGILNMYGGKISENKAYLGGGVFVSTEGSQLNMHGGEISYNLSTNAGGGVITQTHAVTNLTGGKISYNTSLTGGAGGFYVSTGTTLNMSGGEITYNTSADGATMRNGGGLYVLASTVNMSGGVVGYNKGAGGGGFYLGLSGTRYPTLNISGTALITGNEASASGGGIFATGQGTKITMTGGEISKNKAANGGGLITQTKSSFEFTGGKINNNSVTSSGGGVYISTNTTFKMTGGTVSGNVSKSTGGGIAMLRCNATINGGSISNNTGSNGAGLKVMGATLTLGGASITGNRSIGTLNKTTGKYTGANGAGIYIGRAGYKKNGVQMYDYPNVTLYGPYVAYNHAGGAGAGMLVESDGTKFTMYSGTFAYNEAPTSNGGGIYFSNKTNPKIYGGKIYGNEAKGAAAIYSANNKGIMENLVIYDNENSGSSTVIITGADTVIDAKNIEIYDNVSAGSVGGIAIQGKAVFNLENAKIHNNVCKSGGGGVYFSTPGFGVWKDVEIYENESANNSGGVFVGQSSWVTFENVTIRDNVAGAGFGGGLFCRGRLDMTDCKILNNEIKEGVGGGLATSTMSHVDMGQDAGLYATNCVISGNKAGEEGGGVYGHRGGPIYLHSCTITDNVSGLEGGGAFANGRFGLVNCTVTGNTSGGEGYAVYFTAAEFDGHSYSTGHKKVGGDMIIKDNNGGEMYLGEGSAVAVVEGPLGAKTYMEITLHSGVISEHLFGEYDYEGGDLEYIITAGNRSLTDPEKYEYYQAPVEETEDQTKSGSDVLLYAGIGVIGLAAIAAAVLVISKKKKSAAAEKK